MSNKNKNKNKEAKEEVKTEEIKTEDQAAGTEAQGEVETKKEDKTKIQELLEDTAIELVSFKKGNREVDLAVDDALKALERVSSLVAFIEKASKEKKK